MFTACLAPLLAALVVFLPEPVPGQSNSNARWDFLRLNLGVFPGTEQLFEPDEHLFWRLKAGLRDIEAAEKLPKAEYRFRASTDERGRRRMAEIPEARRRILFLGDSCTFGIPVNDEETFPSRLQSALRHGSEKGVQCINAGVPGYTAFQGRRQLELWQEPAPDIVVITFWPNGRTSWDHLSDAEHGELLTAERAGEFSRHRLTRLLRRATPGGRPRLTAEEFAAQVRVMIQWCRERRAVPVVQIWPMQKQTVEDVAEERQEILRRLGREENVSVVDLVPVFRKLGDPGLFTDSVHATAEGYAVAATALQPVVEKILHRGAAAKRQSQ